MRFCKSLFFPFILVSLVFVSCKNRDENKVSRNKDELILAIGGEVKTGFDPTIGWGQTTRPIFQSTLLKYDKDFNIINDAALDYKITEDGLKWTVKLRDSIQFSDGKPLTADDVLFTFETAKNSGSVVDLTNLKQVNKIDSHNVQFTLFKRNYTFIHHLLTLGIVPKHAYSGSYGANPIGSGPYQLVQWDKGEQLIVKANPYYYGKKPYFKKLVFLFLSEDAAFAAAKSGQVDFASVSPTLAGKKIDGMELVNLKSVDNRGVSLPFIPNKGKTSNGNAVGNNVTSDIAIRKAMNVGVDRKALVTSILKGYGTPAYSIADGLPWWNPDSVIKNDGDIEKAKEILENGGWKVGEDGVRKKNNIKAEFTLYYFSSDQTRQSLAIAFADMMKKLGIKIEVKGADHSEVEKQSHSNAVLFGFGSHDPLELYNSFSTNVNGRGFYNTNFYSNAVVDANFENAFSALSQDEANVYWKKAQWDGKTGFANKGDAPWVWLVNINHLFLKRDNLIIGPQKIQPHDHDWPIMDFIEYWHWKE